MAESISSFFFVLLGSVLVESHNTGPFTFDILSGLPSPGPAFWDELRLHKFQEDQGGKAACDFTCQPLSIHIYVWFKPPHRLQRRRVRGMRAKCRSILTAPAPVEILKLKMKLTEAPPPSLSRPFLPLDVVQFACKIFWIRQITRHYTEFVPRLSAPAYRAKSLMMCISMALPPSLSLIQISTSIEIAFISMHDSCCALSPQHSFFSISLREMEAIFLLSGESRRN